MATWQLAYQSTTMNTVNESMLQGRAQKTGGVVLETANALCFIVDVACDHRRECMKTIL